MACNNVGEPLVRTKVATHVHTDTHRHCDGVAQAAEMQCVYAFLLVHFAADLQHATECSCCSMCALSHGAFWSQHDSGDDVGTNMSSTNNRSIW